MLRFEECPEVIPIVVQRVNEKSTGAGEEVMAAAAAAFANAFFDRLRALAGIPVHPETRAGGAHFTASWDMKFALSMKNQTSLILSSRRRSISM